jgi:serine/threonine protein kinase
VRILDQEKTPRFTISNPRGQSMTLEASDYNDMMRWVLALRGLTFANTRLSMSDFTIVSVIGRGYYGKVMLCQDNDTKQYCAIKSVHKSRLIEANKIHTILRERNILVKVNHPFIVSLKAAFQTPSKFYFVLEYAPGGELFYHLQRRGPFPLEQVRLYAAEIALALHHLHDLGIIYRDLKTENILLDADGHIKLTDFGLSKDLAASDETSTFCGTPEYLAPEIVRHLPHGMAVDWWMLGILVFELLFGVTPFANDNRATMFRSICNAEPRFPPEVDPDVQNLIARLLTKDAAQRADFPEIQAHPFFRTIPLERVMRKEFTPVYVPQVRSQSAAVNFDTDFTREPAQDSFVPPLFGSLAEVAEFSFVQDEGLMQLEEGSPPNENPPHPETE